MVCGPAGGLVVPPPSPRFILWEFGRFFFFFNEENNCGLDEDPVGSFNFAAFLFGLDVKIFRIESGVQSG
jgi:hypothetical protein